MDPSWCGVPAIVAPLFAGSQAARTTTSRSAPPSARPPAVSSSNPGASAGASSPVSQQWRGGTDGVVGSDPWHGSPALKMAHVSLPCGAGSPPAGPARRTSRIRAHRRSWRTPPAGSPRRRRFGAGDGGQVLGQQLPRPSAGAFARQAGRRGTVIPGWGVSRLQTP